LSLTSLLALTSFVPNVSDGVLWAVCRTGRHPAPGRAELVV